jgi:hypothetical protein
MAVMAGAMPAVGSAADEIQERCGRCLPYLARLLMLAGLPAGEPFPAGLAVQISHVAGLVLAEARAAGLIAAATVTGRRSAAAGEFLAVRQARLAAAAAEVVAAAGNEDAAALRGHLRRFEALTSAMWAVYLDIGAPAASPLPAGRGPERTPEAARAAGVAPQIIRVIPMRHAGPAARLGGRASPRASSATPSVAARQPVRSA